MSGLGMVVFGSAVTDRGQFEAVALPGIRRAGGPEPVVIARYGYGSIQEPYNEILDEAAGLDDLEALVLVHQDLELLDGSLLPLVWSLIDEPRLGVMGLYGARGVPMHFWTETSDEFGRAAAGTIDIRHSTGAHEVEVVDGSLLVLMPWVVRTVRFSEALAADFHGYDVDFCMRVRAAGGRVVCVDAPYRHRMRRPWTDAAAFQRAGWALASMWDPALRPLEWAAAFRR